MKARAAEVLGVAPESVKNWMQEFIPYWSNSARRVAFPGWLPSDLTGRPREIGQTRESRDRMFADFEMMPEQEFVDMRLPHVEGYVPADNASEDLREFVQLAFGRLASRLESDSPRMWG